MKKIIITFLTVLMVLMFSFNTLAVDCYGDVNKDNKISSLDALIVLQHSSGYKIDFCQFAADVNKDGNINSSDALYILQIATGHKNTNTLCNCPYCSKI